MSFISTLSPDAATNEVLEMYQHQQEHWGYVPNYAKTFSHRPEVLARWGRLLAEIRRPLDDRVFELATFAAALELKHTSCSLAHGSQLRPFFSDEDIQAIARDELECLSSAEREIVCFSRQVARDASAITEQDVQRLREVGLDDSTVFDIAATAAGRAFFTKLLDALGSLPDAKLGHIDWNLTDELTVGRPISAQDVDVMSSSGD